MSDREALLRGILADPADDTPRLVYADWLEENGHCDYSEFIRVQIDLAIYPIRIDFKQVELDLWHRLPTAATFAPWSTGISVDPSECKFWLGNQTGPECIVSRGFVSKVRYMLADWIAHGPRIVAEQPVQEVEITTPIVFQSELSGVLISNPDIGILWEFFDHDWPPVHSSAERAALAWARHTAGLPSLKPPPPSAACGSPVAPRPHPPGSGR